MNILFLKQYLLIINKIKSCILDKVCAEIKFSGLRPGEKLYEELLLDEERNDQQVFDKIFVGNIKGAKLEEVMDFVENLSEDDRLLAREVVAFANR